MEEGRVTYKREAYRIGICSADSLSNRDIGSHAKAGVDHIKRLCIAEGIAADVTGEHRILALHSLLYRIK